MKRVLKNEKLKIALLLLICSFFVCIPLLNKNLNIGYDDGVQHIARLMGTYQSILEGQKFPVIMSEFCNRFWIFLELIL